ncbi:MAG: hypothetical protein CML13_16365 [Puniceicoccaceae bacterium]|nr:hypothetical protein [Puniceicoccaceae bacterium]
MVLIEYFLLYVFLFATFDFQFDFLLLIVPTICLILPNQFLFYKTEDVKDLILLFQILFLLIF